MLPGWEKKWEAGPGHWEQHITSYWRVLIVQIRPKRSVLEAASVPGMAFSCWMQKKKWRFWCVGQAATAEGGERRSEDQGFGTLAL